MNSEFANPQFQTMGSLGISYLHNSLGWFVECASLSNALGYKSPSAVRSLICTNWKNRFENNKDFYTLDLKIKRRKRGVMVLSSQGLEKVLKLSRVEDSKKDAVRAEVFAQVPKTSETSQQVVSPSSHYEITQRLLVQLRELKDPHLCLLAIESAEIALGRGFGYLRAKYEPKKKTIPAPKVASKPLPKKKSAKPVEDFSGPIFQESNKYWSFTEIGQKAGGFSSVTAGKAANKVAKTMGISGHALRLGVLPFNKHVQAPDTNGKMRAQVRFRTDFANAVISKLRKDPEFKPKARPVVDFNMSDESPKTTKPEPKEIGSGFVSLVKSL